MKILKFYQYHVPLYFQTGFEHTQMKTNQNQKVLLKILFTLMEIEEIVEGKEEMEEVREKIDKIKGILVEEIEG